ncbi:protein disulfide oxidoreductase [Pseudocitrobacter cyperus]|uniref:Protein disulfide oxidoreductase n=1 Tax=Pseudocitrobacter cyperus TaxID=3112843 RepID=A0ABV0HII4_9ENTR
MRSRLRRWLKDLVVLILIAIALMWGMDQLRKPDLPGDLSGIALQTLDGERHSLAEMSEEQPVLLYVWATWCGVCRYTTPAVEQLSQEGAKVLSVALRSGDDRQLAQWMAKKHLTMPVVNDPRGEISTRWQVSVTPTLVVISRGRVVNITTGWTSGWGMRARLWWAGFQ